MKLKQILAVLLASPFVILILNNPAKAFNLIYRTIPTTGAFYDAGNTRSGYLYLDELEEIDNPRRNSEFWKVLTSSYPDWKFSSSDEPVYGSLYIDGYRVCPPGTTCASELGSVGAELNLEYVPNLNIDRQPDPLNGNLYWIQLVKNNHSLVYGHGVGETVIDVSSINPRQPKAPYYSGASSGKSYSFYDASNRLDIDENHDWKAWLFLAEDMRGRKAKIYGGVKWGWHNRVTEELPDTPVKKPPTREQRRQEQKKKPQTRPQRLCFVSCYRNPPSNGGSGGGGFNKYDPNYRYTTIPESTPAIGLITLSAWAIVKTLKRKN